MLEMMMTLVQLIAIVFLVSSIKKGTGILLFIKHPLSHYQIYFNPKSPSRYPQDLEKAASYSMTRFTEGARLTGISSPSVH
jgi:hypothetical protein